MDTVSTESMNVARLYELINSGWVSQALCAAAELRVPEALGTGPLDSAGIAKAIQCDVGATRRLLRALTTLDICTQVGDDTFAITELGALLAADAPASLQSWALLFGQQLWPAWGALADSVRTGTSFRSRKGFATGFHHLQQDPNVAALFHRAMVELTRAVAHDAAARIDLSRSRAEYEDLLTQHDFVVREVLRLPLEYSLLICIRQMDRSL
jgi:hypothetical protein